MPAGVELPNNTGVLINQGNTTKPKTVIVPHIIVTYIKVSIDENNQKQIYFLLLDSFCCFVVFYPVF